MKTKKVIMFLVFTLNLALVISCSKKISAPLFTSENKYHLTTEEQLINNSLSKTIDTFYNKGIEGVFVGKANVNIYYRIFKNPKSQKAILISAGRTEAAIKYKELIFDLYNNGFSVFIHDHRGQGLSGRMTTNADMGYVDDFQFYIDDMKFFYENYVKPNNYKQRFLIAHSMGGAIGMTYLQQHVTDFTAASFSSPMLGLKRPICRLVKVLDGPNPKFAIGESEYKDTKSSFNKNVLTGSQVRYDRMVDVFNAVPEAQLGGATYTWINKSCKQFKYMFESIDQIQTPFILFTAKNEQIVHTAAHYKFVKKAQNKGIVSTLYEIENAQHELLIEKDYQRLQVLSTTLDFFTKYL